MNRVLADTGARYPIVQAPMGWIARTQLASAVSRAGGLGIIETSSGETEACQAEINKMKALNLPFGVNLPCPRRPVDLSVAPRYNIRRADKGRHHK